MRQLHYFKVIVESGTMAAAASELNVAPTALSLQIKAMEANFGEQLLERHSRGVLPTHAGVELYQYSQSILDLVSAAEANVGKRQQKPVTVRFGVPPSALRMLGVDAVLAMREKMPNVDVTIFESLSHQLVENLKEGEVDFAIVSDVIATSGIKTVELFEEDLVFVTSINNALFEQKVTLAQALKSDLVFYKEHTATWRAVHSAAKSKGLKVNVSQTVESIDLIRQLVSRGIACAILPYGVVSLEAERSDLLIHDFTDITLRHTLSLAWREGDDQEKWTIDFKKFVKAFFSEAV